MKLFYILALSLFFAVGYAQQGRNFYHHEYSFTGGINSQGALELEPAYSFLFNKYLGVTVGLLVFNFSPDYLDLILGFLGTENYYDDYEYDYNIDISVFLRPAVRFRIPLVKEEEEDIISLNIEPGAFLNIASNTHGVYSSKYTCEKLFFHLKNSLTISLDRWDISAGCGLSNFDRFGNYRNKFNTISFQTSISYRM